MNRNFRLLVPAFALVAAVQSAGAQTSQKISIQGSGLFAQLYGDAFNNIISIKHGVGGELQLRYTPGKWSFGGGIQYTKHDVEDAGVVVDGRNIPFFSDAKLSGIFIEPRYVIDVGSARYAPYISGRFAFSRMKIDFSDEFLQGIREGFTVDLSAPTGPTINGGGGVLIRLGGRANLDLGVTFGYTKFNDIRLRIIDDSGTESSDSSFPVGSGTNAVFRLGLAFGLGG